MQSNLSIEVLGALRIIYYSTFIEVNITKANETAMKPMIPKNNVRLQCKPKHGQNRQV
jgi:hypothetical protein